MEESEGFEEELINKERDKRRDEIRALLKLRCGNLEKDNKYWVEESRRKCIFCDIGRDNIIHYVRDCKKLNVNFKESGREEILERLWNERLDETKGTILSKL
ncbi:hypothetical protein ALC62_02204 [Cyphomyrmex costatus]|uniref:Uncharacterized protein n=1 Tax=Cyphomyrmex costatus TaxID=456900 RepID=A0A195D1U9_9HYME|nr:hypothetical protein ALC62_02204 [Cyphomyrmex costatus]